MFDMTILLSLCVPFTSSKMGQNISSLLIGWCTALVHAEDAAKHDVQGPGTMGQDVQPASPHLVVLITTWSRYLFSMQYSGKRSQQGLIRSFFNTISSQVHSVLRCRP